MELVYVLFWIVEARFYLEGGLLLSRIAYFDIISAKEIVKIDIVRIYVEIFSRLGTHDLGFDV